MLDNKNKIQLLKGDCLEIMKDIPDGSIDMILCDLPYGTTATKKPKFDKKMNFYKFDNTMLRLSEQQEIEYVDDRSKFLEGFGVDITTLSEILEGNNE